MDPLPADEGDSSELDDLVREIDRQLDASFLDEIEDAMERARRAVREPDEG